MKKTPKKSPPKSSHKKAKDLEVKPAKGGRVRGGITVTKTTDSSSTKLLNEALQGPGPVKIG